MPKLNFTSALKRFFPALEAEHVAGSNVSEVLINLEKIHPGICDYIVDEKGELRKHVNIFVEGELIKDRKMLQDSVNEEDELFILQALSGG